MFKLVAAILLLTDPTPVPPYTSLQNFSTREACLAYLLPDQGAAAKVGLDMYLSARGIENKPYVAEFSCVKVEGYGI